MSWCTYILLCDNKSLYVGITSNLQRRLKSHKSRSNLATKKFKQMNVVYHEIYNTRSEAERREKQVKGWSRAKKNALIKGQIGLLIKLSKSRSVSEK